MFESQKFLIESLDMAHIEEGSGVFYLLSLAFFLNLC